MLLIMVLQIERYMEYYQTDNKHSKNIIHKNYFYFCLFNLCLQMHQSIVLAGVKQLIPKCTSCCKLYHCPLCPSLKPMTEKKVQAHWKVHIKNAIFFEGKMSVSSVLFCFVFLKHFKKCTNKQKRDCSRHISNIFLHTLSNSLSNVTVMSLTLYQRFSCMLSNALIHYYTISHTLSKLSPKLIHKHTINSLTHTIKLIVCVSSISFFI